LTFQNNISTSANCFHHSQLIVWESSVGTVAIAFRPCSLRSLSPLRSDSLRSSSGSAGLFHNPVAPSVATPNRLTLAGLSALPRFARLYGSAILGFASVRSPLVFFAHSQRRRPPGSSCSFALQENYPPRSIFLFTQKNHALHEDLRGGIRSFFLMSQTNACQWLRLWSGPFFP